METQRLKYFVALAQERSFVRTAAQLYISQPALTQQIQKLEAQVGSPLIDRSARPWDLTAAGHEVLRRSKRILREVEELEGVIEQANDGLRGRLRLGLAPSTLQGVSPQIIRSFSESHPEVEIKVEVAPTSRLRRLLEESRIDLAVLMARLADDRYRSREIHRESSVIALPKGHRLADRAAIRLAELSQETLLIFNPSLARENNALISAACVAAGFVPHDEIKTGAYIDQIRLVAAGFGVALVPESMSTLHTDNVSYHPIDGDPVPVINVLAWDPDTAPPAAQRFIAATVRDSAR